MSSCSAPGWGRIHEFAKCWPITTHREERTSSSRRLSAAGIGEYYPDGHSHGVCTGSPSDSRSQAKRPIVHPRSRLVVRSPRSRGKGNRRFPGRPGGARPKKLPIWRNRAQHLVASLEELSQPVVSLVYRGVIGEDAAHNIYLFDQRMGKLGISYFVRYRGRWWNTTIFTVIVSAQDEALASEAVARIQR